MSERKRALGWKRKITVEIVRYVGAKADSCQTLNTNKKKDFIPFVGPVVIEVTTTVLSSRFWELYFRYLTLVNRYPLMKPPHRCKTCQSLLCHSQLSVIMVEDKAIILGPNELPNLVGPSQVDDRNYLQWTQYIHTMLKKRKKLSHIEAWDDEDSLIMTWLWNSMTPEISRNYMFYSFVHEIWENLIKTYSMKKNSTTFYDIESKIFNSRQGTLSITEYYGTLNGLWIKLDQYYELKMCKADSIAYTGFVERGRIFKFLHGLNFEYDPIQVQILGKEKLPSLFESEKT
ncbi:hypothetical protein CR513_42577, partial [Mucuna pruriens]